MIHQPSKQGRATKIQFSNKTPHHIYQSEMFNWNIQKDLSHNPQCSPYPGGPWEIFLENFRHEYSVSWYIFSHLSDFYQMYNNRDADWLP